MEGSVQEWLVKRGVPTWMYDIGTPITANQQIQLQQTWPTDIHWIYGIFFDADGVDQNNNPLPTTTQMSQLYLFLKNGANDLLQYWRLSNLLLVFNGTPVVRPYGYIPVSIPGKIDTSNSYYYNPLAIAPTTPPTMLHFKLWYMKQEEYNEYKKEHAAAPHHR